MVSGQKASRRFGLLREWPFASVAVAALAGLFLVGELDRFRRGSIVFAAAFGLAALLRLLLPTPVVGVLAVRGKVFDVLAYAALAVAIAGLAIAVPGDVLNG